MRLLQRFILGMVAASVLAAPGRSAEHHAKVRHRDSAANCARYGAGFRYLPAARACIKIGGWVGADVTAHGNGHVVPLTRGGLTTDVRTETGYGTFRAYTSVGVQRN
jgi:Porin subfamily